MPALVDNRGDGRAPVHAWESASILRYLARTYDSHHVLGFEDPDLETQMDNWIFWTCVPSRVTLRPVRSPDLARCHHKARLPRSHAGERGFALPDRGNTAET